MERLSKYSLAFKAKVALEVLRGDVTLQELAQRYSVSPSKISEWLSELETHAHQTFERSSVKDKELKKVQSENKRLLEKVGQLSIDCDFFCEHLRGIRTQSEIIEMEASRPAGMSRKRFCACMSLNRSTLYSKPKGESAENLELMQEIDRYYLEHPTAGVLHMQSMLTLKGYHVNVKRVRRLMHLMPIYPKPSLSKGTIPKYVHPYLLRGLDIQRPNQVWSTDISHIPVEGGFMYLYAMMDVYSRYVLGWRLSNTHSGTNCIELLEECIRQHGTPEIVNSDQGVQYTSHRWVSLLEGHRIKISMDGRGRCKDTIWIERFWRTIKQEYIYLNPTKDVMGLRSGIAKFMRYYNYERPHQSLELLLPARQYGIIVAT